MALDSLLIRLKSDVSPVSDVQPNIHAGYSRYGIETAGVSPVSDRALNCAGDTPDTAAKNHPYQPEPAWNRACTADTGDTRRKINAEPVFVAATQKPVANDLTLTTTVQVDLSGPDTKGLPTTPVDGTVIDIGTVQPPGLTPLLLATSLALDAQIHAAGLDTDRHATAMRNESADLYAARLARFTDKGVIHGDAELVADKLVIRDRDSDDRRLCLECSAPGRLRRDKLALWQLAGRWHQHQPTQHPGCG
ncbi:MAG: hypothetical protein IPN53_26295 [Comamonadaceae bacterium]|nr:hypothetical protein [Comamonadaceae bacterium]